MDEEGVRTILLGQFEGIIVNPITHETTGIARRVDDMMKPPDMAQVVDDGW